MRADGSSRIQGEFTAECTAVLPTLLDPLTAPRPEQRGVKDPRTAGQRRHDGLLDALTAALRAAQIPSGGDTRIVPIVLDQHGAVTGYTDTRRLFTETQRLALIAGDGGCSFPGCDAPPQYCEAHHIRDHAHGGRTSIDNGTLLRRFHDHFHACGWRCELREGRPAWIPPPWVDHTQTPLHNPMHDIDPRPNTDPAAQRPTA